MLFLKPGKQCTVYRWFTLLDMENTHQKNLHRSKANQNNKGKLYPEIFLKQVVFVIYMLFLPKLWPISIKSTQAFKECQHLRDGDKEFKANLSHLVGSIPSWTGRDSRLLLLLKLFLLLLFCLVETGPFYVALAVLEFIHRAGLELGEICLPLPSRVLGWMARATKLLQTLCFVF